MPKSPCDGHESVSCPPQGRALWFEEIGRAAIRAEPLAAAAPDTVRVRMLYSGISRGTESLVFAGRVPPGEHQRMRAPFQAGDFGFPVKYGYAAVGTVEDGPDALIGRTVFCLHPHQDLFRVPATAVTVVPAAVPPARAVLAANMETALNALWDGGAGPGDRIVVVGAGAVGALTAALAGRLPGAEVTLVDIDPARAAIAAALGVGFALPEAAPGGADLVFHASARSAGLATALALAGDEATVVEMSWYGTAEVSVCLGGGFHAQRLKLVSSQVGRVAPGRRSRWDYRRRLAKALDLLADDRLDVLLGDPIPFDDLPARLPAILTAPGAAPCPLIQYPARP